MEVKEVEATRILNPTSIDLGEYVINPYKGCAFACLYCYARFSKAISRDERKWGEYLDARVNAPRLLEKELKIKKPTRVLLGSTTDCFQEEELKRGLTKEILEILNSHGVYYSILTRSPFIISYLDILKKGYCETIYFTVNNYDLKLKSILEPKSPSFEAREKVVTCLLDNDIPVIPSFSPVFPFISKVSGIFEKFEKARAVNFEGLNFNLGNIAEIVTKIEPLYPKEAGIYKRMIEDKKFYDDVWYETRRVIMREGIKNKKRCDVYIHELYGYFGNKYRT
ncbi:radical SAM domain protein [Candidatus Omnitrophus magneticus]|uniref:Radical SAM domain protein n=1 Tax=Candidatus Omnitrophus magneticus TaxID=1609969 RepID=A0A0F0CRI4_9BACT|nr:radical SAM domain protein [Candidatus Omnitrophus magneticus]